MKDPLGVLMTTKDEDELMEAMRELRKRFTGQQVIDLAGRAGWLILKDTDFSREIMQPGYTPFDEDDEEK